MARSFLNATTAAAVKAAAPQVNTPDFRDKVALGMAIGGCYRAKMTRGATILALTNGPAKLTTVEAEDGVTRWEKNQRFYGKVVNWSEK